MDKREIVKAIEEMAVLMTIDGANTFKVRAFENGARTLDTSDINLDAVIEAGELDSIKGIGKSLAEIIATLHETGSHPDLEELREKIPASVAEMTKIPGFGPKKAALVYHEADIETIDELEVACKEGKLSGLRGFGAKTINNILNNIAHLRQGAGRFRLDQALAGAEPFIEALGKNKDVIEFQPAGSLRRRKESVHDLDFVIATKKPKAVLEAFVKIVKGAEKLALGETKASVRLSQQGGMQVDARCVAPEQYPHALQHFTGSKEHNVAVRSRARKMGLKVSEWGLFPLKEGEEDIPTPERDDAIYCKTEAEIYEKLGLAYIPPERREDLSELTEAEAALGAGEKSLPAGPEMSDLRGMIHCHSTYSDGKASLEKMARATHALGFEWLAISDHSQAAAYAGGLQPERVKKQWEEIDKLNDKFTEELDGFRILKGIEADILLDGSIDYANTDPEILDGFEFVVASLHSSFQLSEKEQTERVLKALEDPHVTIIGHLTTRLILQRRPVEIDVEAIIKRAAELGVALEINANPRRLDLDWRHGAYAREQGMMTCLSPDAHSTEGLEDIRFGIWMARKAGFAAKDLLNTMTADEFLTFAQQRRG